MKHDFYTALEKRRSIYALAKESPISDERIREVVSHALDHTPSAFNSQSAKAVVLQGAEHEAFWSMAESALRAIVPEENFAPTKEKLDAFSGAYGTVLYFEDYAVVEGLQAQFPLYKDNFPIWSHQASGMLQYNIWTAFAIEGLGASLQHYNELVEEAVKARWGLPEKWKLIAQMPFGTPAAEPDPKQIIPASEKLLVFNS